MTDNPQDVKKICPKFFPNVSIFGIDSRSICLYNRFIFGVPVMQSTQTGVGAILGAAMIEPAVCQGCGSCVAECPAQAIELKHFTDAQLQAKVHALLSGPVRGL